MTVDNYLMELDEKALIEIIDKPENQDSEYRLLAKEELKDRKLSPENIKELAIIVNAAIAYEMVMKEEASKEKVSMHKSSFLNEEEIRQIYIEQLEQYIKYKNQFRFDVWSYALGGV